MRVLARLFIVSSMALTFIFYLGCAPSFKQANISDQDVKAEKEKQQEIAFDTLIKRQKRLYDVSYPLLAAASSMNIDDMRFVTGFMLCTKDAYPKDYQDVAKRYFNLSDNPVIYYVHPKFPAAKAGIKPGDRLVNYNGNILTGKSFKEIKNILQENQSSKNKQIVVVVEREGQIIEFKMEGEACCKYFMGVVQDDQINALSDGKNILINTGLIRAVENDDELAFVVAHEIAHNVLGHIKKKEEIFCWVVYLMGLYLRLQGFIPEPLENLGELPFLRDLNLKLTMQDFT